jgi:hypothetical protein
LSLNSFAMSKKEISQRVWQPRKFFTIKTTLWNFYLLKERKIISDIHNVGSFLLLDFLIKYFWN